MRIFAKKNLFKKLILVLILITILAFVAPQPVHADIGGVLMKPISNLLVGLCDGIINVLHRVTVNQNVTLVTIDLTSGLLQNLWSAAKIVLIGVAVAAAIIFTGGLGIAITGMLIAGIATAVLTGAVLTYAEEGFKGVVAALGFEGDELPDTIHVPLYSVSPEEIFKGEVPLFDVNFFDPDTEKYSTTISSADILYKLNTSYDYANATGNNVIKNEFGRTADYITNHGTTIASYTDEETVKELGIIPDGYDEDPSYYLIRYEFDKDCGDYDTGDIGYFLIGSGTSGEYLVYWSSDPRTDEVIETSDNETSYYALSYSLSSVISKWYYILLKIAIVAMMSILVYIGIRILISSVAEDKAKYKKMLGSWVVGVILLFSMHYIMVFANALNDLIIDLVENATARFYTCTYVFSSKNDKYNNLVDGLEDSGITLYEGSDGDETASESFWGDVSNGYVSALEYTSDGSTYILIATNYMGSVRMQYDYAQDSNEGYIGYAVMFIALTILTVAYMIIYFKRVMLLAFLTIIAPLVAVTYPLDKTNDGVAQGFNMWFKEYMFNLLLQPMHLLLYVILVGSALEVASENLIWSLVVMMFMTQGEEILRRLFNFQKANTPGGLKGAVAAGAVMTGMQKLANRGGKGDSKEQGGGSAGGGSTSGSSNVRESKTYGDLFDDKPSYLDKDGYDKDGYDERGFNRQGKYFDNDGDYDEKGYDVRGFNAEGQHMNGGEYDDEGYNVKGFNAEGRYMKGGKYDEEGKDVNGNLRFSKKLENKALNTKAGKFASDTANKVGTFASDTANKVGTFASNTANKAINSKPAKFALKGAKGTANLAHKAANTKLGRVATEGIARNKKRIKGAITPKNITKGAMKITGGAIGLTAGVAAGVASGDLSKVGAYAVAGAVAGGKVGSSAGSNVSKAGSELRRAWIGEDAYEKKQIEEQQKSILADDANIRLVQKKYKDSSGNSLSYVQAEKKLKELNQTYGGGDGSKAVTTNVGDMINIDKYHDTLQGSEEERINKAKRGYIMSQTITEKDKDKAITQAVNQGGMTKAQAEQNITLRDGYITSVNRG